ncbi:hypothetical protein BBJ29_002835 [Phytophthora kernoviae]|uniref:PH domain-containing protein n=1 Tax=Phytophthora kernoviae TaxID=325452 RepID=A0A3F2RVB1_9STRA|nr:hypothetical protein BBJ29_002835 [Phytophthora kernoviae]RLN64927.1 hypothetical protein BBP00_00003169 [Phytophthora kernoviae]
MCSEPKPFGFLLFIKDQKLTLAAASERERHQWIDVFCDVFHASVEQAPTDNKAERRARPTFLPIPDMGDDGVDQESNGSNLIVQPGGSLVNGESGEFVDTGSHSTPTMAHNMLDNEHMSSMERSSFGADVIPILESRMTYGPLKEMYSRITFPPSLANGDLLVGVGPIVRRMGWTDERILAVGMYIDPEAATRELEKFNGRIARSLHGDQEFYDHLLFHSTFRRSFVVTARKRVSKSVLTALMRDELSPRMGPTAVALRTFLGFIEKSLKKAESMVLRVHEDGRFEFRMRGQLYPPIASHSLCKCIQALFFDSNSIQHDAKRVGTFQKHLVFKVDTKLKVRILLEYFDTRFRALASTLEDAKSLPETLVALWDKAHPQEQQQHLELCPKDEARISIAPDGNMTLRVKKRGSYKEDKKSPAASSGASTSSSSEEAGIRSMGSTDSTMTTTTHTASSGDSNRSHTGNSSTNGSVDTELALPPPPYYMGFQSLLYGFHAIDPPARKQLMERLPNLLDLARDDLVHTYHDEIQALRENYKRQKPENRVKVGYLSISFEKRKMQKNTEKGGAKEATVVPSRWSKRWCRLDGTLFSYYSHKRSRKYRDMMELTRCEVVEITSNSAADVARFGWEKGDGDSIRIAIIKPNGEILALRTETIYEGEEWLESLTDASKGKSTAKADDDDDSIGDEDAEEYDSEHDLVEKDGSLLAWVQEDPRHAIITFLLVFIVYLASVMHRNRPTIELP